VLAPLLVGALLVPVQAAAAPALESAMTLTVPRRAEPNVPVKLSGRLTFASQAPGTPQPVQLTRTFQGRTQTLATLNTKADGTFTYTHVGPGFGLMTYRVDFAGNATHSPAFKQATTRRRVPGDLHADGYSELPVGLPFRNVDGIVDAGAYAVVNGSGTGAKGTAKLYTQNSPDIADVAETDDALGWAHTTGDFNGDGYGDAVVGSDEEGRGAVNVLYGSPTGLTTTRNRTLRNGMLMYAFSVTALDVNNDGYDDVAVSAPGRGAKSVVVYFGGTSGLYPENSMTVRPGVNGVPGTVYHWESFGFELRAGDFNGDGYDDLAVGDPYDWNSKYGTYGSVTVLYGRSGSGPSFRFRAPKRWDKDSTGVIGTVGHWVEGKDIPDYFGWSLGVADYNGDGRDDLAIGSPGSTVWRSGTKYNDAGAINVLYGSGSGLTASGDQQFTLDTSGVPGVARAKDYLGLAAAGGDTNGDGRAEVAFSAETRQFVIVLRGGARALTTTGARWITQNTAGVPGSTQPGGFFGAFLRFAHLRSANYTDLVVSAPEANNDRGTITVLPRAGTTGAYLVNIPANPGDWAGPLMAKVQSTRTAGQAKPPA
jgi:FG-GAP repeat protein/VCBS repeat protein